MILQVERVGQRRRDGGKRTLQFAHVLVVIEVQTLEFALGLPGVQHSVAGAGEDLLQQVIHPHERGDGAGGGGEGASGDVPEVLPGTLSVVRVVLRVIVVVGVPDREEGEVEVLRRGGRVEHERRPVGHGPGAAQVEVVEGHVADAVEGIGDDGNGGAAVVALPDGEASLEDRDAVEQHDGTIEDLPARGVGDQVRVAELHLVVVGERHLGRETEGAGQQ